jgi:asparagine synthase (glutamine-hydrolysing)
MCGITGLVNINGEAVSPVILKRMTDAISHRGPDGEGHWIDENIGIGHRRLAIIDLSAAGHQPMISADHRFVLSYNGEIYNYRELRIELEAEGVWFRSRTDSEVVLNALTRWGKRALTRFNGMFALALWDRKERTLLLARDRYGIKPLYYSQQGSIFAFASEQKAITAQPSFQRHLNQVALLEYFTFQNIFTDQTLLRNINLLPAGHWLELDAFSGKKQCSQYWDFWFREPKHKENKEEYLKELDRLFKQAVSRQLISDVELGAYLSGGIDSGCITALTAQEISNLKSFTVGFDLSSASGMELCFDERTKAEAMSGHFKTEHYEMVLKAGDMERCLSKLTWHLEEPRVGQSYPNYYAAQLASKFVKVVLAGSGGDELFGGYPWRYYHNSDVNSFDKYVDQYYLYWQRLASNRELKKLFSPVSSELNGVWTRDIFSNVFLTHQNELNTPEDYINHSLYFEAKTFLHGLFVVEDKLSMAHSLETRVPFMDNDLVDFAMKCPVGLKLNKLKHSKRINENDPGNKVDIHFQKTNDGKQILREVMAQYIPKEIIEAQKQGFSSPDASWFKGQSIEFVKKRLLNPNAAIYQVLNPQVVKEVVEQHMNGSNNRRLLIWSLLNVDEIMATTFAQS